jgi:hypothetical protein
MNIFKHFIYRHLWQRYINLIEPFAIKLWWHDNYDVRLKSEVFKYSQVDFINWLEKEIDLFLQKYKKINFTLEIQKSSLLKIIIFDTYIAAYMWDIESDMVKFKLENIINYIEKNYTDSNKLSLCDVIDYKNKLKV